MKSVAFLGSVSCFKHVVDLFKILQYLITGFLRWELIKVLMCYLPTSILSAMFQLSQGLLIPFGFFLH